MNDFLLMVGGAVFAMVISGIINYKKSAWVGLTSEDYNEIFEKARTGEHAVQLAEAKLKEKNAN